MKADKLDGFWKYVTFEMGGQSRSQQQVESMASGRRRKL